MSAISRFDAEAAQWDSNPTVHRASALALDSILHHFPQLKAHQSDSDGGLNVLEIGCGTGLLSFMVAPYVRSLIAVDSANGMIEAFKLKLAQRSDIKNILPVCAMLVDPDDVRIRADPLINEHALKTNLPPRKFDLVLSHLVLHHIPSLREIFDTMFGCLKSGGSVALTDFEDFGPEARKFHPEAKMEGVERHGIRKDEMKALLSEVGFVQMRVETAFEVEKDVERSPGAGLLSGDDAATMTFPFLICMAKKP